MDEFLKLLLPIFLTALGAYGLYQIEKDHKRRALAQQLRTEIGIITFAVKIFFKDWETKGNGDRVIKEYKGNNFFQINAKIYSANLTNLNLLGQELLIELALLYANLNRFQQTPLPKIIKKFDDGFSHGDAIFDGAKRSLHIIIPRLCFYTLPWWRRIGLSYEEAYEIVSKEGSPTVFGEIKEIPKSLEKFKSKLNKTKAKEKSGENRIKPDKSDKNKS